MSQLLAPQFSNRATHRTFEFDELLIERMLSDRVVDTVHRRARAGEDAVQSGEVLSRDRVELVIVAASTGGGQSLKRLAEGVDLCVEDDDLFVLHVNRRRIELDEAKPAGSDGGLVDAERRIPARRQQVARQVLAHESVVRHVSVQGSDQIVAVSPRMRDQRIVFGAVRVAVTDEVHPVPRPVLAEVRRRERAVDEFVKRIRRVIGHEALDLVRFRRQSGQHERKPPRERPLICVSRRLKPRRVHPREQESVNRRGGRL